MVFTERLGIEIERQSLRQSEWNGQHEALKSFYTQIELPWTRTVS